MGIQKLIYVNSIGAGGEKVNYKVAKLNSGSYNLDQTWIECRFGIELGYRFRFQPKEKKFFYDIDILGGYRKFDSQSSKVSEDQNTWSTGIGGADLLSASIAGTFNYKIVKGLYAGVGLQPTIHYYGITTPTFDLFASGRIGYDLGFLDLSVSYKQGLMNKLDFRDYVDSRLSGWQISLYIPFSQHQKKK